MATLRPRLPTGTYESFTSPRCTAPAASRGFAQGAVGDHDDLGRGQPAQHVGREAQRAREVGARVGRAAARDAAASSSATSPVIVDSGVTAASICAMSMRSAPPRPRDDLLHLVLASSMRVRFGSSGRDVGRLHRRAGVDEHDDVAPLDAFATARGSPSASTSSASSASCRSSERRRFSCEKRLVASLSRRMRCQIFENGTATGRRRSFRM